MGNHRWLELSQVEGDTMLVNVMSKKIQSVNTKEALIRVDKDAMSSEALENNS